LDGHDLVPIDIGTTDHLQAGIVQDTRVSRESTLWDRATDMRVVAIGERRFFPTKPPDLAERKAPLLGGSPHDRPGLSWRMAVVAAPCRQRARAAARFLTDPADLAIILRDRLRLGDLDAPAALLLLPQLR